MDAQDLVGKYSAGEREFVGACLVRADLSGADLSRACLDKAYLNGANLEETFLYGANLTETNLTGVNLEGAHPYGADLSGATMPDGTARSTDPQEPAVDRSDPIHSLEGAYA